MHVRRPLTLHYIALILWLKPLSSPDLRTYYMDGPSCLRAAISGFFIGPFFGNDLQQLADTLS